MMDRSGFLKALSQLQSTRYTMPKVDMSPWKSVDSMKYNNTPVDIASFLTSLKDFTSTANPPASSGGSGSGINLWNILSGTLGQPAGYVTSMVDKAIKDGQKDFNGKSAWYKELGNFLSDANPASIIGGTAVDGIVAGAKQQWGDWTDGKAGWGDIPLAGFLHGMDTSWKHGSDIATDIGVNNRWGNTGLGLGLDIALDPLTYLTGGLSAATKFGKVAEAGKMTELAGNLGLDAKKFKNVDEFANAAQTAIKEGHANSIAKVANDTRQSYSHLPNLVDDMVTRNVTNHQALLTRQMEKTVDGLKTQVNAARNQAINSHINDIGLSLPFTNKIVKTGEYSAKSLLHRSEATVSPELVDKLLHTASGGNAKLKGLLSEAAKARYGANHIGELTKTHFDDLHQFVSPVLKAVEKKGLPDVNIISKMVEHTLPHEDFAKIMDEVKAGKLPWKDVQKQLEDIMAQTAHDPVLRSSVGSHLSDMVSKYWKGKPVKNFSGVANSRKAESMKWVSNFMKGSDKYQTIETALKDVHPHGNPVHNMNRLERAVNKATDKMAHSPYDKLGDHRTNMEHFFDKHNVFNARTLGSKSKLVNSMADHVADAHSERIGNTARYSRDISKVKKYLNTFEKSGGNKEQLMQHAIYLMENHAPDSLGKDWLKNAPSEAHDLANLIKPIVDKLGKDGQEAGTIDKLRSNYFPHVVNTDPKTAKDMTDFFKRNPTLSGMKSTTNFNKARGSFQTLAQKDNYLVKIEKAIQHETDPEVINQLRSQQERVAKMFDTNVVSALQRRVKDGVRANAMKAMQTKLSKYGMMAVEKEGESIPAGLDKLPTDEAKKLGLQTVDKNGNKVRNYIHPEILKGMKRVDEIFTSEGMNKFTRHMNAFSDVWRPLVTYYKPSHYVNNIIGNVVNNMAAGVKVSDYRVAAKLLRGYKAGKLTNSQMKIIDDAYKHNVISGGFLNDSHATFNLAEPSKLEKFAKKVADNKAIKGVRHVAGELPDDISRLANYVNGMNKFGKSAEAAKQVRTYLFNYHELTNSDRTMRIAVPFWNWMKRNIPLQMKTLMENPKFAMNNVRVMQLFNNGENGASWQKESGFHIPKTITNALGAKNEYYTSNPSPVMDLNNILNPVQELGSMNPLAKMITEMALNRQYFTGNPISYGSNTLQAKDVPSYLAKNFGITGNLYDLLSGAKSAPLTGANLLHSVTKVNSKNPNGG